MISEKRTPALRRGWYPRVLPDRCLHRRGALHRAD
jgi:hypothetical protein